MWESSEKRSERKMRSGLPARAVPGTTSAASVSKEVSVCLSGMLAGPEEKRSTVVQLKASFALGADFAQIYCTSSLPKAMKFSAYAGSSWM